MGNFNALIKNLFFKNTFYILLLLSIITIPTYLFGLWQALFFSPPDYVQGNAVRIMYVHVPAAWLGLGIYLAMAISNSFAIIYNNRLADILAYAAAPVGMCFTLICLITGSIWGKPIWGIWWVWDARLTSMLILFFLYIGYMILWDNKTRFSKSAAVLNIIGAINIPIIKFSVNLWNTLHQPASILREGGVAIDKAMLWPLFSMFIAAIGFALIVSVIRAKTIYAIIKRPS